MSFFKKFEGAAAILVSNGVYRQVDMYTNNDEIFVALSGGFVRLKVDKTTSKKGTYWLSHNAEDVVGFDELGRLTLG